MIKRLYILVIVQMVCTLGFTQSSPSLPAYKDRCLSIDIRLSDLLSRMTLEEKVGQLLCPLGWEMYEIHGSEVHPSEKFKQLIKERNVGMLWATYRADPWTKKTIANGLNPELAAKAGNALQKYVMENTRLGIPMFLAEEAPHGHMAIGTTVFPTGIGMAATWSPELVKEVGHVIAKEIRSQGGHISYGPVLDLTRDPRWSRVEETFGEDPVLSGILGASMVDGLGGGNLSQKYATIATLKHFLAYAVPEGGQNGNYASVGIRDLHQNFLPPFRKAIDSGALSVMTSYNSIDGIPCTSNHYLLTQLLRNEWKFCGFVVSDLYSIEGIHESHFVALTKENAAIQSVTAGVDVDLGGDAYTNLCHAVQSGQMDKAVIDTAVCRVLRMKFEMGLFEHPYVDPKIAAKTVRRKEHIELARKIAQSSITLLKNENSILPLSKTINKVAVIGPNADNRYNMLGDYTAPQEDSNVKTVLDGILTKLSPSRVEYVRGCAIRDTTVNEIEQAIEAARRSEVVIVVVGGSSARDFKTSYKETGAAVAEEGSVSDMECGEGFDRASLSLLGRQQELLESLQKTGKPLIVVYIEGRPLEKNWASEYADALLTAYYPGQEGGKALAEIITGKLSPSGKLPVSIEEKWEDNPVYGNYYDNRNVPHKRVQYAEGVFVGYRGYDRNGKQPLYPFGYGLSYSSFEYSNLSVEKTGGSRVTVSFDIKNTGKMDAAEAAQVYVRDVECSVPRPLKELKGYDKVYLKKGETKRVRILLDEEAFAYYDVESHRFVVEKGTFEILAGPSSADLPLKATVVL